MYNRKRNHPHIHKNIRLYHSIYTASFIYPTFIEFYRIILEYYYSQNLIFYHHFTHIFYVITPTSIFIVTLLLNHNIYLSHNFTVVALYLYLYTVMHEDLTSYDCIVFIITVYPHNINYKIINI